MGDERWVQRWVNGNRREGLKSGMKMELRLNEEDRSRGVLVAQSGILGESSAKAS